MPAFDNLNEITLHLLRALEAAGVLRVRWRYGVPTAEIDGFTLLPAEYFAFANDLSYWETITGLVDGQTLSYTVQRWRLVEEHETADNDEYTEMAFTLNAEGRDWLLHRASSRPPG